MKESIKEYLATIGRRGGLISRRKLSTQDARNMAKVREARRAYRKFHAQCFWSFDLNYKITMDDIKWVGQKLMENGNLKLWKIGSRLCR